MNEPVRVVKLGGSAMEDPQATAGMLDAVATLWKQGTKLVLVHGGGKPIDRAMEAAGLEVKKVLGRRYTDAVTLAVVVEVLLEINAELVRNLKAREITARGQYSGSHQVVMGRRLMLPGIDLQPVDLGFVGQPSYVDSVQMQVAWNDGVLPIVPSLAMDDSGGWLNVNADTAAAAIAGALHADAYFLTDTPGVLANRQDPASLYSRLTVGECLDLIRDGVIEGGMIPKVEACFEALEAGSKKAVILDGRVPDSLLTGKGTEIVP